MRRVLVISALLAGLCTPAFAQIAVGSGSGEMSIAKSALSGQEVRLWGATMLEPDCTAHGTMTTQILDGPHHGKARLDDQPFYPSYPAANARSACNTKKSPGRQLFYVSDAGYRGVDTVVMQNATSEGSIRRVTITIDVK